tara:strand:+ start:167 stop:415 length:249 start_codon:yes stop_codon:yes gene_type:complete
MSKESDGYIKPVTPGNHDTLDSHVNPNRVNPNNEKLDGAQVHRSHGMLNENESRNGNKSGVGFSGGMKFRTRNNKERYKAGE